nr:retrovirus-related Pol polyprotein from transposon TNT 1-94 [Tanacetum cinerariifolium]
MPNPKDITDPTTAMNMTLALMAKAFKLNYSTPTNNKQRISSNPRNRQISQPGNANQNSNRNGNLVAARAKGNATGHNGNQIRCYKYRVGHFARNYTVRPRRRDTAYLQTQLLIAQKEEAGIQLQAEEFDLMAATADLDEIEEVNANCILMANLQQASTSGTQTGKALVYDSHGSAEVCNYENCYDNEIFNMFTQEEQYTELLEPITEPHQVLQNDNNVISKVSIMEQSGGTVEQHPTNVEETPDESLAKHKALELEIERLLRAIVSDQKDTTCGMSADTKFAKQSILRKPPKVDNTKTRRLQPRSNTMNDRVPSASKSSRSKNKEVEVEEHHRKLLLSRNKKHMSSKCNNVKLATQNVKSIVVCAMCKHCLNSINHDPKVKKTKKLGSIERLALPKPSKPRSFLRWSPTERMFDLKGKIIASSESESQSDCSKGDNACTSNPMEPTIKRFPNSTFSLEGQFCDSNLEVAFRRNACFIRNLKGVDLLKGDRSKNLYTINLHEMAFAFLICLMARASSTKSWLWHQRLSHLNFDTINDLAKKDLVSGLPKLKYQKEHLFPSCEQGKSKKASHPPKPVPNSRQ